MEISNNIYYCLHGIFPSRQLQARGRRFRLPAVAASGVRPWPSRWWLTLALLPMLEYTLLPMVRGPLLGLCGEWLGLMAKPWISMPTTLVMHKVIFSSLYVLLWPQLLPRVWEPGDRGNPLVRLAWPNNDIVMTMFLPCKCCQGCLWGDHESACRCGYSHGVGF
jgi:hypothetical protein